MPTVNEALPPLMNSFGVISRPAMNSITMAPICPSVLSSGPIWSSCWPSHVRNEPRANGPTIMPASSSPSTMGSFRRKNSSAMSFAAKSSIPMPTIIWTNSASAAMGGRRGPVI